MKMKIEMVEKYTKWSLYGRNTMLICRRYKILYATLIPLELSFHPNVIQYLLITALSKERALHSHLSTLTLTYGKMISQQAPALSVRLGRKYAF